jgi:uncharacterized protein YhbP (UPF0306 family)
MSMSATGKAFFMTLLLCRSHGADPPHRYWYRLSTREGLPPWGRGPDSPGTKVPFVLGGWAFPFLGIRERAGHMPVERSTQPVSSRKIRALVAGLLDASALCAIATRTPRGVAYVNTAYFARSPEFDLYWLSDPQAEHSRNLRANPTAAVAVYDSTQSWGESDRGIQLFGSARLFNGSEAQRAERSYSARFPGYRPGESSSYRVYRFRPRRVKLFDEAALGGGVFVTASVRSGQVAWERTEIYRPDADARARR